MSTDPDQVAVNARSWRLVLCPSGEGTPTWPGVEGGYVHAGTGSEPEWGILQPRQPNVGDALMAELLVPNPHDNENFDLTRIARIARGCEACCRRRRSRRCRSCSGTGVIWDNRVTVDLLTAKGWR